MVILLFLLREYAAIIMQLLVWAKDLKQTVQKVTSRCRRVRRRATSIRFGGGENSPRRIFKLSRRKNLENSKDSVSKRKIYGLASSGSSEHKGANKSNRSQQKELKMLSTSGASIQNYYFVKEKEIVIKVRHKRNVSSFLESELEQRYSCYVKKN